eukprot:6177194-Pleurochrysis_carterae.AAC.1
MLMRATACTCARGVLMPWEYMGACEDVLPRMLRRCRRIQDSHRWQRSTLGRGQAAARSLAAATSGWPRRCGACSCAAGAPAAVGTGLARGDGLSLGRGSQPNAKGRGSWTRAAAVEPERRSCAAVAEGHADSTAASRLLRIGHERNIAQYYPLLQLRLQHVCINPSTASAFHLSQQYLPPLLSTRSPCRLPPPSPPMCELSVQPLSSPQPRAAACMKWGELPA